jgi:hypothetical protein
MTDRRPIEPVLGSAIPALLERDWRAVANVTRWTESVPVEEVQAFVDQLPGEPVRPTADQVVNNRIVLQDDGDKMHVLMPIALTGSDQVWGMSFILSTFGEDDGQMGDWLWGLGKQRLMSCEEVRALASQA